MRKIHSIVAAAASIAYALAVFVVPMASTARAQTLPSCAWEPEAPPVCTSGISGQVMWPDRSPGRNVIIDLVPNPPGIEPGAYLSYADSEVRVHTDSSGRYEASTCPCLALMAFLEVGSEATCGIPMAAITSKTRPDDLSSLPAYNGVVVQPGDQIGWIISGATCHQPLADFAPGRVTQEWFGSRTETTWQSVRDWIAVH